MLADQSIATTRPFLKKTSIGPAEFFGPRYHQHWPYRHGTTRPGSPAAARTSFIVIPFPIARGFPLPPQPAAATTRTSRSVTSPARIALKVIPRVSFLNTGPLQRPLAWTAGLPSTPVSRASLPSAARTIRKVSNGCRVQQLDEVLSFLFGQVGLFHGLDQRPVLPVGAAHVPGKAKPDPRGIHWPPPTVREEVALAAPIDHPPATHQHGPTLVPTCIRPPPAQGSFRNTGPGESHAP